MKKSALLFILLLLLPGAALAENAKIDLTFEDSGGNSKLLVADSFKTIKRSNVSLAALKEMQNKIDKLAVENKRLRKSVEQLQKRLENLERKIK